MFPTNCHIITPNGEANIRYVNDAVLKPNIIYSYCHVTCINKRRKTRETKSLILKSKRIGPYCFITPIANYINKTLTYQVNTDNDKFKLVNNIVNDMYDEECPRVVVPRYATHNSAFQDISIVCVIEYKYIFFI